MKIAVIDSSLVDLMSYIDKVPAAGEMREVADVDIGCSGKGANQAIAAVKILETMKKASAFPALSVTKRGTQVSIRQKMN